MGLTVHFRLSHPDSYASPDDILALMERLRSQIADWGVDVSPIVHLVYPNTNYQTCPDEGLRWFLIQAQYYPQKKGSYRSFPRQLIGFTVFPDPPFHGSEPLNFAFSYLSKIERLEMVCFLQDPIRFQLRDRKLPPCPPDRHCCLGLSQTGRLEGEGL
ncbi:hypothetical protein HRbin17_01258 [bacterium HR17]|uniref:Uncharacterized protein n=1 Tax=Candidatus Fervidibacter japonicus TaxID=2035412 RepID=A0A2H5XC54_9BACT|nr:hypothetical protein HRbin17_01258 [bacterium HR17]